MEDPIFNKGRATTRADSPANELILGNKDQPVADAVPPSDSPPDSAPPLTFSSRIRYSLYSTSTAPQSTAEMVGSEPSLGPTGRAVSIAVMAILLLLFCLGVTSYFCWRKRTRFYKEKGQILRIWNDTHSKDQPSSPALAPSSTTISEPDSSQRPASVVSKRIASIFNISAETRPTQCVKMKITTPSLPMPSWKLSRTFTLPSRPATVTPTAFTANKQDAITTSAPSARPAAAATAAVAATPNTFALAGYVPDPVIGAYMDNARRQYAAHLAKTGNYPPQYLNPATAPNLLMPTVPASLFHCPSSTLQESSKVSSSSSSTKWGSLSQKPKTVWERTSDLFSNHPPFSTTGGGRPASRVSKNHVSRFFQENARPHSLPLYAPQYYSDEDEDKEDDEEEEEEGNNHGGYQQGLDKEGRAYRHPNDSMVRTPMTVQEAQAAAARIMAMGEERKQKMGL